MTTPPPIPPEALDGQKCIIDLGHEQFIATYYPGSDGGWNVSPGIQMIPHDLVERVVPMSVCLAAPGMREALAELAIECVFEAGESPHDDLRKAIDKANAVLAAREGKGEGNVRIGKPLGPPTLDPEDLPMEGDSDVG